MGAITVDESKFPSRDRWNDRLIRQFVATGPASYTTGGDALPDVGMGDIYHVSGTLSNGTNVRIPVWNYTTQKLQFWDPAAGTEAANLANLSAYTGVLTVIGKG